MIDKTSNKRKDDDGGKYYTRRESTTSIKRRCLLSDMMNPLRYQEKHRSISGTISLSSSEEAIDSTVTVPKESKDNSNNARADSTDKYKNNKKQKRVRIEDTQDEYPHFYNYHQRDAMLLSRLPHERHHTRDEKLEDTESYVPYSFQRVSSEELQDLFDLEESCGIDWYRYLFIHDDDDDGDGKAPLVDKYSQSKTATGMMKQKTAA